MVICDSHGFAFIRVPKNASTSLATFFVKNYCGPNDKYTSIGDSGVKMHNIDPRIQQVYRHQYRFIHLTLNEIISEKVISAEDARSKRIIGVLRDPLDRQLSLYFFLNRGDRRNASPADFRRMFKMGHSSTDESNRIKQVDYLKIDDKPVGEWWLYDDLDEHINRFIKEMGVTIRHPMQTYKGQFRPKGDLIDEYYDKQTRDAVMEYYAEDYELMEKLRDGKD